MPCTQRFTGIDGLRGLAALAIVLCHLPLLTTGDPAVVFQSSQPFVLFFLVLSGFMVTHAYGQTLRSPAELGRFVLGRTLRIFPLHLVLLALIVLLQFTSPWVGSSSYSASPENLAANLLLLHAWFPGFEGPGIYPAAWTLSASYYLWLLFGLASLILPRGRSLIFAGLLALSLGALLLNRPGVPSQPLLMAAVAFFAGTFVNPLYQSLRLLPLSAGAFSVLELTSLGLLILVVGSDYQHRVLYTVPLLALMLFIFAFERGVLSRPLRLGLLRLLGRWSLSLGLIHMIAFLLAAPLVAPLYLRGGLVGYTLPVAALLGVVILAAVSHHLIERPGMALGKRLQAERATVLAPQTRG